MKKIKQFIESNKTSSSLIKPETGNKIKTTNVNILLNRVKMDQKKDFKKKLVLFSILIGIIICLSILVLL